MWWRQVSKLLSFLLSLSRILSFSLCFLITKNFPKIPQVQKSRAGGLQPRAHEKHGRKLRPSFRCCLSLFLWVLAFSLHSSGRFLWSFENFFSYFINSFSNFHQCLLAARNVLRRRNSLRKERSAHVNRSLIHAISIFKMILLLLQLGEKFYRYTYANALISALWIITFLYQAIARHWAVYCSRGHVQLWDYVFGMNWTCVFNFSHAL